MTRINCVPPSELTRQHLIAEYRELPRVFTLAEASHARGEAAPIDNSGRYFLGPGHVRFFYNKLSWLRIRHMQLVAECVRRGYKTNIDCSHRSLHLPSEWQGGWEPNRDDMTTNRVRLAQRLGMSLREYMVKAT